MKTNYIKRLLLLILTWISLAGFSATINVPGDYATIQAAIDAASPGDIIQVAAGTYTQNFNITKQVSIIGAGSDITGTIITQTPGGGVDTKIGVVQLNASGTPANPILLKDLRIQPVGMAGISVGRFTEATGTSVAYLTLNNVAVIGTNVNPSTEQERGLYVDLSSSLFYLNVLNCKFDNLTYGWYFQKVVSSDASNVRYVTVYNTTFNHNNHKGLYTEKLSDASFLNCVFDENGYNSAVLPSYFAPWSCGVDLNLKAGTYSNFTFTLCTVTNNGHDQAKEGVGLTVKGRDDGSYATYPAIVSNVTLNYCTITNNERGIRFGEPGKNNSTPTNVVVQNCNLLNNTQHYSGTDGSAYGDYVNQSTAADMGEYNWWGDTDPSDQVYGNIDYTPWLTGPAVAPVYNVTQGLYFLTIQSAIDYANVGDNITIAAGTYTEQLHVTVNNLNLSGAGVSSTIIKSPTTLTWYFGTSPKNYPVVFIEGVNTFTMSNLTVDGDGKGNSNYRFQGIGFWNAGGNLSNVNVIGVRDTPFSGSQHGVAVYAYNNTSGPYTITINGMDIYDFQKNAMALSGDGLTVDLDNINITGAGSTSVTAQNGIQIGFGASGTIDNATVTGIDYVDNVPPVDWCATAILLYNGGTIDMNHVTVTNSQTNVYFINTNGSFNYSSVTNPVANFWADGLVVSADSGKEGLENLKIVPSPYVEDYEYSGLKSALTVNVDHSTFTGIMNTECYGIAAWAEGTINMDITYCDINYWDYGIVAYEYPGGTVDVEAHFCDLSNNNVGFYTNASAKAMQDATESYWGHATGPYHYSLNPGGLGSEVSDGVLFEPWWTNPEGSDAIDIGIYNTTCADFEIRLKPSYDLTATSLTNIQFTVKWPETSGVSIINVASPEFGIAQQGPTITDGGYYYAVFVGVPMTVINWTAGTEYVVMTFSHNELGTGSADFVIAEDTWATNNNGMYYVEQVGMDVTGGVYHNALNVLLESCDLQLKVFLAGPYNPTTDIMDDQVRDAGFVPTAQPYNVAPWTYNGTEALTPIPDGVVDWVLVELRSGTTPDTRIERKAGLLLTDGSVVKHDDMAHGLRFDNVISGELYYVLVWHRNHMPVMTAATIALPNGTLLDLTTDAPSKVYGYPGKISAMEMETGVYGLIAGDVNANGELKYSGPNNDRGYIISRIVACNGGSPNLNNSCTNGYWMEDVNINNVVLYSGGGNDRDEMLQNFIYVNGVPYLHYVYQSAVPGALTGMKDAKTKEIFDIMLLNKGDRFEIVLLAKEDIYKGVIDNVQFTLAWNSWDAQMSAMVASQLNYYGISAQGPVQTDNFKTYQVFVGVNPVYLPEFMKAGDQMMVMSILKKNEAYAEHFLEINNDEFSLKQNGEFYVSVWGEDVTGMISDGYLGIENGSAMNLCRVYPNPVTNGTLTVEIFSAVSDMFTFELLSLEGKVLISGSCPVQAGERFTRMISTDELSKGNYLIKVSSNYQNFTDRIIVK